MYPVHANHKPARANCKLVEFEGSGIISQNNENLALMLDQLAALHPEFSAITEGRGRRQKTTSYGVLAKSVAQRAARLKAGGVKNGDRVLLLQTMSTELYINILALFRIGASALIVDIASGARVLDDAIALVKPSAVIGAGPGLLVALSFGSVRTIKLKFSNGFVPPGWIALADKADGTGVNPPQMHDKAPHMRSKAPPMHSTVIEPVERVYTETPALITFTSGSGGKARAIVRTHGFLKEQLAVLERTAEMEQGSCELTALPVFVLANLASSTTTVLPDTKQSNPSGVSGKRMVEQLLASKADRILGSPSFVEKIVEYCEQQNLVLPQIHTLLTGGGPVFPGLLERCKKRFPSARLFTVYGSTEAEPISKIELSDLSALDMAAIEKGAGLPVGKPVDGIEIRIMPLEINEKNGGINRRFAAFQHICDLADVPLNKIGEIIVTGNHVVKGYYQGLGDSAAKLMLDGKKWHKTGDVGYLDKDGRLWLVGRIQKDDALETTFSYAVEAAVLSHPSVQRAAFVARAQSATLFVEMNPACQSSEFSLSTLDSIGWAEVTAVRRTKRIPLDTRHNTKVLYNELK